MDDFTERLLERTRARQEAMQQKKIRQSGVAPQRKRRPLLSQNSEENLCAKTSPDRGESKPDDGISESPNKRTRTEFVENTENVVTQRSASDSDVIQQPRASKRQSGHVNQRMQRLLNQRKIWEAEEQGDNISFDEANLPSPISSDRATADVPTHQKRTQSLEHQGRKHRLAALAARVKDWEDDITHHDPPKSPEKSPVRWKPPTGRVQQVSAVPVQKVLPQKATAPTNGTPKLVREDGDDLSVDSLVKFAVVGKSAEKQSPAKSAPKKSTITLGNNAKTILQTKQQTITVNSFHGPTDKSAAQQPSRTLQQRMQDLQSNGITEADLNAMNTSSANFMMERARAEREKELAELRNRKVHGMPIHGKTQDNGNVLKEDEKMEQDDVKPTNLNEKMNDAAQDDDDKEDDAVDGNDGSQVDEEVYTSACDKSQPEEVEDKKQDHEELDDDDEEDEQEISYSDSLLDEDSTANEEDLSVSDDQEVKEDEKKLEEEEEETSEDQMIDDLFEGVLSEEEQQILTPPPRSNSPITIPRLTRQKSKLEIKSELTVRKQTCNEAEDMHKLSQPSKFQRTCLSKSNSTESIVSLCQENDFPVYTISAYRTEKRRMSARVDKRVVRNEAEAAKAAMIKRNEQDKRPVQETISDMMEQVGRQQRVIQQASAALNCCYDAHHGKGTITEVEAEKLLLISSEKRLALLAEIQQLKQKKMPKEEPAYKPCPGAIIVSNIRLPLRTEYIFSIANRRDAGELRNHYYFVLVRNKHQMFSTQLASTLVDLSGDSLVFKDQFKIDNLSSDFKIVLEVYSLNHRTRADGIPVQDKSKGKLSGILHKRRSGGGDNMKKLLCEAVEKTKSKVKKATHKTTGCYSLSQQQTPPVTDQSLTPKKLRTAKRTPMMPSMMSPGGPNAIRISNFALIGSTTVTLNAIAGRKFALQKVPFLSPISGQLLCKFSANFQSAVEQRGFLTMFDDVGGLGAWHRRWCALRQGRLYSWTYPDDEQHKKPLMSIVLRECISRDITTVERMLCARPNTFELRTMRPRRQGDRQNLISDDTGSVITTKHWLSADTKEERIAWIESLNQALVDVRAWDTDALKPFK